MITSIYESEDNKKFKIVGEVDIDDMTLSTGNDSSKLTFASLLEETDLRVFNNRLAELMAVGTDQLVFISRIKMIMHMLGQNDTALVFRVSVRDLYYIVEKFYYEFETNINGDLNNRGQLSLKQTIASMFGYDVSSDLVRGQFKLSYGVKEKQVFSDPDKDKFGRMMLLAIDLFVDTLDKNIGKNERLGWLNTYGKSNGMSRVDNYHSVLFLQRKTMGELISEKMEILSPDHDSIHASFCRYGHSIDLYPIQYLNHLLISLHNQKYPTHDFIMNELLSLETARLNGKKILDYIDLLIK